MSIWGNDEKIKHLEEEKVKLWGDLRGIQQQLQAHQGESQILKEQIQLLEDALKKKTSDYEAEAKEASERASDFETISKGACDTINAYLSEANSKLEEIKTVSQFATSTQPEIQGYHDTSHKLEQDIQQVASLVEELYKTVNDKVTKLNEYYSKHTDYVDKVTKLEELHTKGTELYNKTDQFYKTILGMSEQINKVHLNIIGYTDKDDKGEEVKVPGLKDQLETEYSDLISKANVLQQKVSDIEINTETQYITYVRTKEDEFNITVKNWNIEHEAIVKKLNTLLPEALTKGLSAAYYEKKVAELAESQILNKKFGNAITGLVVVSLIPFVVSIFLLFDKTPLKEVILDMPRLVLAILPLYIPVLWLAYSSNKSLKLSKRLIEEYTHKEVLSKTFEGLSTQIANVEDKAVSADLKNRLLYNILEVNSENPGKLISDYNKSDHPLMDALDKSVKLGKTIEKLADIPGVGKFAGVLEKRVTRILEEKKRQAETGIEVVSEEDEGQEKETK